MSVPSLHRASLQGYLVFLIGVLLIVENTASMYATGASLASSSGIALGLLAIGGGALGHLRPKRIAGGEDPAPAHLYVFAVGATMALGFWLLSSV